MKLEKVDKFERSAKRRIYFRPSKSKGDFAEGQRWPKR
jgi:hypothetical protein